MVSADLDFAYLTTVGRKSGRPRTIEIWYGVDGETVYFLSGGGDSAQWVQNLTANPNVTVRIGRKTAPGQARIVENAEEDMRARRLLAAKYQDWAPGKRLSSWARSSLPVAVDLSVTT